MRSSLQTGDVLYSGRMEVAIRMGGHGAAAASTSGRDERSTIFIAFANGRTIERVLEIDLEGDEPRVQASTVRAIRLRMDGVDVAAPRGARFPSAAPATLPDSGPRVCGRVTVDLDQHCAFLGATPVYLTAMEMKLVAYLVERQGRLCRLRDILDSVWGTVGDTSRRTLNTHVNRLRTKLSGGGICLETVRNVGLRLSEQQGSGGRRRFIADPSGPGEESHDGQRHHQHAKHLGVVPARGAQDHGR